MSITNHAGHIDRQTLLPFFQDKPPQKKRPRRVQPTSIEAHRSADLRGLRKRVLEFFRQRGDAGATLDELSAELVAPIQSVCPANHRLRELGLVKETDERRETRNGRKAIVWQAVELP